MILGHFYKPLKFLEYNDKKRKKFKSLKVKLSLNSKIIKRKESESIKESSWSKSIRKHYDFYLQSLKF